jgi:DNA polymerase-3 subunit delta'
MPFSQVIGHDRVIAILRRSLAADRISHAYLFHGVDGCGMKETALAMVEAVFCGTGGGCGDCPSCRKVAGERHPDLHVVRPDGAFIKIDQIRELQKDLSYRPFEARKKACIIEEAERMNPAAANAFLKTLEEPPGDALLLLLTTHLEGILPTIISRCQQLRFPPLPSETLSAHLRESGAEEEEARIAAALAGGSLEKAREALAGDRLQSRRLLLERICSLSSKDIIPLFSAAEELARDKESAIEMVELLQLFWRDVLLVGTGSRGVTNSDLLPLLHRAAERSTPEQTVEKLDRISRVRQALARNANPRLAAEVLFMELADG